MKMYYNHLVLLLAMLLLVACSTSPSRPNAVKIGKPYSVSGQTYVPSYQPDYDEIGIASWYGPGFHGKYTANGERFDQSAMTAAHRTLPMPSMVRVTNLRNGKSAIVRVNDRGPFAHRRIIDLSKAAAKKLDVIATGTAQVRVQYLPEETQEYIANNFSPRAREKALALLEKNNRPTFQPVTIPYTEVDQRQGPAVVETTTVSVQETRPFAPLGGVESSSLPGISYQSSVQPQYLAPPVLSPPAMATKNTYRPSSFPQFYIQAGAFGIEENANILADKLASIAPPVVHKISKHDRDWFRVRLGPFESQAAADAILPQVLAQGVDDARVVRD